jgi:hypothetical protein
LESSRIKAECEPPLWEYPLLLHGCIISSVVKISPSILKVI